MYETYYPQQIARRSIANSFLWMAFGLLISACTSYLCYQSGWFLWMLVKMPMLSLIFGILQIGLVFAFNATLSHASNTWMKVLFILYAFTLGITLTSIFYVYSFGVITAAFFISAFYYVCLGIIGFTTKKDLTSLGTLCLTGLFVMIISQIVMMLFRVNFDTRLMSIIGLLIFTGITAWDMQRLNRMLSSANSDMITQEKISIYMALELYLDFINIFLYILEILGAHKD